MKLDSIPESRTKGINSDWLKTADENETSDIILAELVGDRKSLERLQKIIETKYQESVQKDENVSDPNYTWRVAFGAGYKKALKELHRLVTI